MLGLVLIAIILIILWFSWPDSNYFKKRGIPCLATLPIVGTFLKAGRALDRELIENHEGQKCVGGFIGGNPMLFVLDADMLSDIYNTQSALFTQMMNGSHVTDSMSLLHAEDTDWKYVRNTMAPSFTSSNLKQMNVVMKGCSKALAKGLLKKAEKDGEVDILEFTGKYTADVIANTESLIKVNSQIDYGTEQNETQSSLHPGYLLMLLQSFFPDMPIALQPLIPERLFQLLMHVKRGRNFGKDSESQQDQAPGNEITIDDIEDHAKLFFAQGHTAAARSLSLFMYNMAMYPDIQQRLVEEISAVLGDKEEIDTEVTDKMPYLDQCVKENLRMYPPLTEVNHITKQDTTVQGVAIEKGTVIILPISAIHHHPSKWPEPNTFDPQRFSPENREKCSPYDFVPFGLGPRNCIGTRLAVQQLKVAIIHILRKVKVTKSERTETPLVLDVRAASHIPRDEMSLILKVEPKGLIHNIKKKTFGGKKLAKRFFNQVGKAGREIVNVALEDSDVEDAAQFGRASRDIIRMAREASRYKDK